MKILKRYYWLISAVICYYVSFSGNAQRTKPNIVLVIADDLGVPQMGCYGSSYYTTPNIDHLASQGAKFLNAYAAAAVCSPTRASIMTGKHPARLHLTDFVPGNPDGNYPLIQPNWQKHLPLKETTLAEVLINDGYKTAFYGKWHLSKEKSPPGSLVHNPNRQGFQDTFITYKPAGYMPIGQWQKPEIDGHSVDTLTNLAIDFVKRNRDQRFFLTLSHNTIHDPIMEKKAVIDTFKNLSDSDKKENNPVIGAMIKRMDDAFGRLYRTIEDLGLMENTVILFFSDNGAKESIIKQTPYRGGKGWLYEGGIKVPLIIQWKGKIDGNIVFEDVVNSMDIFSTVLDFTSNLQKSNTLGDGESLFPLVQRKQDLPERDHFWNYPHYHKGSGMLPACAVRSGDYKLIKWYEPAILGTTGVYELYDLKNDLGESKNLIHTLPDKARALIDRLETWKKVVQAQEPMLNKNYGP